MDLILGTLFACQVPVSTSICYPILKLQVCSYTFRSKLLTFQSGQSPRSEFCQYDSDAKERKSYETIDSKLGTGVITILV